MDSYVIKIANYEYKLGLFSTALIFKIFVFLEIRMTITILKPPHKPSKPSKTFITFKNIKQKFDQGVHDHDVLVDFVHFPEGGKMQISPKLERY